MGKKTSENSRDEKKLFNFLYLFLGLLLMPNLLMKLPLQLFKLPSVNENLQSGGTQGDSFTFRAEV